MLGDHFYHSIIRKTVSVFGTLFNDLKVVRRGGDGMESMVKIPLSYGPKQKFLARLDQQRDLDDVTKVALKLPRMSFEMTNLTYDPAVKQSSFNRIKVNDDVGTVQAMVDSAVPYIVDMQLNIMVKNQDDGLQILEQILPTFQPTYTVSVKYLTGVDQSVDVPITLNSVSFVDDYEGDYMSRRVIIYTLDFSLKVKFFGGISNRNVIRQVFTTFINETNDRALEMVQVQTNPTSARKSDSYEISTAINFITSEFSLELLFAEEVTFTVGETLLGSDSGYTSIVQSVVYDSNANTTTVVVGNLDGYYFNGETITGQTSYNSSILSNYEIIT